MEKRRISLGMKMLSIGLIACLIATSMQVYTPVQAATKSIYVKVNGKKISAKKAGKKLAKGYLVDAKLLAKAMKLKYSYKKKTLTLKKSSKKAEFKLGSKKYTFKKKKYSAALAPKLYSKKIYVDAKAVAKRFGFKYVKYKAGVLDIKKKKPGPTPIVVPTNAPATSEIPAVEANSLNRIIIVTEGYKEIIEDKDEELQATIYIDDGKETPTTLLDRTNIVLSGRGNSSFYEIPENMPKKPLKFEFEKDNKQSLFGMKEARKWNLLSNMFDRSLIRNAVALKLGAAMSGLKWTPAYELVEVYINGDYKGVYLLTEAIEINKNRIDIDDSGDDLGFIVEWNQRARIDAKEKYDALADKTGADVHDYYFAVPGLVDKEGKVDSYTDSDRNAEGATFEYKDPKGQKLTQVQRDYIKNSCIDASNSILNRNGFADKWNIDSMIDNYLLQNYAGNGDAMNFASIYMYKPKGADSKMELGPIWDYDIYMGNSWPQANSFQIEWGNKWLASLLKDDSFRSAYKARWSEMKTIIKNEILPYIDELEALLKEPAKRNFNRWPCLKQPMQLGNNLMPGSFKGEVQILRDWCNDRIAGMDNYINGL